LEEAGDARSFLPPNSKADDPAVQSRFLFSKAVGQGKELTAAQVAAAAGEGRRPNERLIKMFQDGAEAYKVSKADKSDPYRARAYHTAAEAVGRVPVELTLENYREELGKVGRRRGGGGAVGEKTLTKIEEFLLSGNVRKLEQMELNPIGQAQRELQQVWGIGSSNAPKLIAQGVRTIADLRALVEEGKMQVGDVKLTHQIRTGVLHHDDIMLKIPRAEIAEIAEEFYREARAVGGSQVHLTVCGSYRRGKPSSGDVDCLITVKECANDDYSVEVVERLMARMKTIYKDCIKDLSLPSRKGSHPGCCTWMGLVKRSESSPWRRFDIKGYPWRCYPYALLHMTGSDHFNRSMRKYAWLRGLSLSDHGLVHVVRDKVAGKTTKTVVGSVNFPARDERDIFDLLKIGYVEPQDRHSGYTSNMLDTKD